jgi:hypothetical protein
MRVLDNDTVLAYLDRFSIVKQDGQILSDLAGNLFYKDGDSVYPFEICIPELKDVPKFGGKS